MDKQKQIEEMAREIAKKDCYLYDKCPKMPKQNCVLQDTAVESNKNYITIATWLVNAGYRKIPENAVVLTKEEYDDMFTFKTVGSGGEHCGFYNILDTVRKVERKDTAEKFAERLKIEFDEILLSDTPLGKIDEIAKEFTEGKRG